MNIFYVYIYLDPRKSGSYRYGELEFDNEPIYVGKGKDDRDLCHLKKAKNIVLENKLKKIQLTEQPIIIRHKENLNELDAFDLEILLINRIGRKDLGLGPLLNLTDGGEGSSGWNCTNKTRKRMSKAQLVRHKNHPLPAETREKIRQSNIGVKRSEETKEKLRKAHVGMKPSPESNQKRSAALKGKSKSDQHRANIKTSKLGEKNPMFGVVSSRKGRSFEEIYGIERAEEIRKKIKLKRKDQLFTNETKIKMRESRLKYLNKAQ